MSCCESEGSSCRGLSLFGWLFLMAVGAVVIASLPEIKRYIKISTM